MERRARFMHRAIVKRICLVIVVVHFSSLPEWVATPKEKPLLRVHEVIFSWGWTRKSTLEVSAKGRISLKGALVSGFRAKKATLSAEEIQALRNLLNSEPVQHLQDFYPCPSARDYSASMKIELTQSVNTKRIALCNLELVERKNSKIYPAAIHDLVCKIYGLKQRAGVRYRPTTRIEPDGTTSDDTWCDSASLELIAKPGSAESGSTRTRTPRICR